MVMIFQVTQLMRNDIVNAFFRRSDQVSIKCLSVNNAYLSEGNDRRGHMQQGRIGVRSLLVADQDLSEAVEP